MRKKALPVGIEDFGEMVKNYYYVDKSLFIKELLDKKGSVNLFTRPRRFGKSLNMSMLQHFFDANFGKGQNLFQNLKISDQGASYLQHQNAYPVIDLTFKDVFGEDFTSAFKKLMSSVIKEYERHQYVLDNPNMSDLHKEQYRFILAQIVDKERNSSELSYYIATMKSTFSDSLEFLCRVLSNHYQRKTVILIDEYDTPLEKAYFENYYAEMLPFIRSFFLQALKTNKNLEFAVMTGCLRVSKESIFTGLNNLHIHGITSEGYGEYFGFTEHEVKDMLAYYELSYKEAEIRDWYNGYLFGNTTVYNPWSVNRYLYDISENSNAFPKPYWSNTSSNTIVKNLIHLAKDETKDELETLMRGNQITKKIKEDIVYGDIELNMDNLWNFLFFTGYLKKTSQRLIGEDIYMELKIPNREIRKIYNDQIAGWFNEQLKTTSLANIHEALLDMNEQQLEHHLSELLLATISYLDAAENFYHGFLLGILSSLNGYIVKSNREHGKGRSDITLEPRSRRNSAFIIELKIAKSMEELSLKCEEALNQIEEKSYDKELLERGFASIRKYGIAFYGRDCEVKAGLPNR